MKLTIDEVKSIRNRLHCSLRRATHVAKREQMLNKLDMACGRGRMPDFRELMTEVIEELYKD